MKEKSKGSAGRKLTRGDWIASARKVLITSGIDDVKVDRLAQRMGVTRGSFYWHFKYHKDLLDALLSDWEGRNHVEISQVRVQWAHKNPDLSDVIAIWVGEDPAFPAFDMAVRVWARKSKAVAETVHRVDQAWIQLLSEIFIRNGFPEDESLVRALVSYYHQVGYYAIGVQEELSDRISRLPLYYKVLTGQSLPSNIAISIVRKLEDEAPKSRRQAAKHKSTKNSAGKTSRGKKRPDRRLNRS